jgi:hypothetical protein
MDRHITTATLNDGINNITNASALDKWLKDNDCDLIHKTLKNHLDELIFQKELNIPDIIRDSELDKGYVYQIFSGKRTPSRDKLIAIAFGMHLSLDETQKLLKISGNKELYSRQKRDAILMFAFNKNLKIHEADELLSARGCDTLLPDE